MESDLTAVLVVVDPFIYTHRQAGDWPVAAGPKARPRPGPAADGLPVRQGVGSDHDVVGVDRHDERFKMAHVSHLPSRPPGSPFPGCSDMPPMPLPRPLKIAHVALPSGSPVALLPVGFSHVGTRSHVCQSPTILGSAELFNPPIGQSAPVHNHLKASLGSSPAGSRRLWMKRPCRACGRPMHAAERTTARDGASWKRTSTGTHRARPRSVVR